MSEPKRGAGSVHEVNYHIVWCPKYRHNLPIPAQVTVDTILRSVCEAQGVTIKAIMVMPDHIHLFVQTPPTISPATLVKLLKGISAKLTFEKHPELRTKLFQKGHLWSPSYYVGSVGHVTEDVVRRYVETQKQRVPGRPRRDSSND
ncbi:MAG: IS200/IS605 family transposase [Ilumatobacteraceae bacterium]